MTSEKPNYDPNITEEERNSLEAAEQLLVNTELFPDLRQEEVQARIQLAAATIAVDRAKDTQWDLQTQARVDDLSNALDRYAVALANLTRGRKEETNDI